MAVEDLEKLQAFQNPQQAYAWRLQFFGVDVGGLDDLTFRVITTSLPTRETETIERHFMGGRVLQFAGRTTYHGTDSYTFVVAGDGSSIDTLYDWAQLVQDNETRQGQPAKEYMGSIQQELLKISNDTVQGEAEIGDIYKLKHVWPTNSSDFDDLDYNNNDDMTLTADFTYSDWYKEDS